MTTNPDDMPRRERQSRRRVPPVRTFDNSVPSPCISVCRFDGQPWCRGCYRDIDEIRDWMIYSREQKLATLERIRQRRLSGTPSTLRE